MEIKMENLITEKVASPPTVYHKLQAIQEDPASTFEDYQAVIQADTGIASRIMKIANSPFYGFESKVESIQHAMSVIGLDQMTDLVLVTLVIDKFRGIPRDLVDMDAFWRHSLACGLGARLITKHRRGGNIERSYLSGILHEIGSLVMYQQIPVQCRLFIVEAENDKKPLYQVELDEVGFNHAQLGGHLLKVWRLPNSLVETVTYQHDPCNAPEFPELASTLHMADCMVYSMELGCSGQRGPLELVDGVLELLGLTPPAVDEIRQKTQDLYNTTLDTFLN